MQHRKLLGISKDIYFDSFEGVTPPISQLFDLDF
jgi:hypothetical protein